jgi:hypothetical protein
LCFLIEEHGQLIGVQRSTAEEDLKSDAKAVKVTTTKPRVQKKK